MSEWFIKCHGHLNATLASSGSHLKYGVIANSDKCIIKSLADFMFKSSGSYGSGVRGQYGKLKIAVRMYLTNDIIVRTFTMF